MKRFAILGALALLAGCAVTTANPIGSYIPGRMVSLSDGKVYPMQIQLSYGSGKVVATDPVSGEILDGSYTAIQTTRTVQTSRPTWLGDQQTATAVEQSNTAEGTAILVGNQGTVVSLKLHIRAGNPPIGYGEGEDNKGKKYSVQF